ncbi:hypothetical protein AB0M46_32890 [Dactylosporangium sp. NPDC051485]|uniref:NACHT domain-containing protein n=1 Tax=Dactylosporangium sp. NPDC051485 TaxID=3154846 RepID=UPI00342AA55A
MRIPYGSRSLSYRDAVTLLDGADGPITALVATMTSADGDAEAATMGDGPLFAQRGRLVTWCADILRDLPGRIAGIGRFERTEILLAVHSILAVTAYLENTDQDDLNSIPFTRRRHDEVEAFLTDQELPAPSPDEDFHAIREHYRHYYESIDVLLGASAAAGAHQTYSLSYARLAADVPEFAVWAGLETVTLREILASMSTGAAADARRADLAKRYRVRLDRSILDSAAVPQHVAMPTLGAAYVSPRCRVRTCTSGSPASESWWHDGRPVEDLGGFLGAHLTTPWAVAAPLVVLGQPGSGKSVLTRVLAATMPENDFLVVRVELRSVPADTSVQNQIEQALYQEIGERVGWAELSRSAGDALPVVLLDGFDELLQATGVNQSDYLERVRQFQEREADVGRPAAVVVTSRTVVADRARFPDGTVVVRLEPFDEPRVRSWLSVWNGANTAKLGARSLAPLPPEAVLAHPELAGQPLLLLLLALYDATANELQRSEADLGRGELYERLFADFIDREVDKLGSDLTEAVRREEAGREWRRLTAVAIAMLNRGGDVITEAELDADMPHLLDPEDLPRPDPRDLNRALTVGQFLVGRFFFIHDSQATRDVGRPETSFEFLHATFGEFLAARHIVTALNDLAADRAFRAGRRQPGHLDAGYFSAATSFVTVTRRGPLRAFCQAMLDALDEQRRAECLGLVLELLPDAGYPHPRWSLQEYEPLRRPVAARHAAFSANLVWLAVVLSRGRIRGADLFGDDGPAAWIRHARLWQSQLPSEDFERLVDVLRVEYDGSDVTVSHPGGPIALLRSLGWVTRPHGPFPDFLADADSPGWRTARLALFLQEDGETLDTMIPIWRDLGPQVRYYASEGPVSAYRVLLELLLRPATDLPPMDRLVIYGHALDISTGGRTPTRFAQLVWRQLRDDLRVLPPADVARMLLQRTGSFGSDEQGAYVVVTTLRGLVGAASDLAAQLETALESSRKGVARLRSAR